IVLLFLSISHVSLPTLPSFPTRRSSDLAARVQPSWPTRPWRSRSAWPFRRARPGARPQSPKRACPPAAQDREATTPSLGERLHPLPQRLEQARADGPLQRLFEALALHGCVETLGGRANVGASPRQFPCSVHVQFTLRIPHDPDQLALGAGGAAADAGSHRNFPLFQPSRPPCASGLGRILLFIRLHGTQQACQDRKRDE